MTKIKCEAGQFKKFVQAVRTMTQESRLHIDADGLSLICVDTANVGMVKLSLPKSEIKDYQFQKKTPSTQLVALEWSKVSKMLNATKPQTPLLLEFKEHHLRYTYDEIDGEIMYLDTNTIRKEPNPPNIVLDTEVEFDGSLLTKMGKIMTGDKIALIVKEGLATISFEDGMEHKATIILSRTGKGKARSLYSWDYIKDIAKTLDRAYVTASFKDDHPIRFHAKIQGIDIEYLLAPRIESG